jgi:hypothetical protein
MMMKCKKRATLTKIALRLLTLWEIPEEQQALLLGLPEVNSDKLAELMAGKSIPVENEFESRVSYLINIHHRLKQRFPRNIEDAYQWVSQANSTECMHGQRPLDTMLESLDGLEKVSNYLDVTRYQ